ncbi:Putative TM nitroreductase [Acetitomaculum ruminis DSM 5522]|uniref:Putative TM nitroreductase n=1 Tax=Acetitomaculum ruminis DSM 5522 TaxID=1120918 RepID=A0A1I0YZ06_9FIRM|nr:nitroreductase family protein [Acetitomaculum ruminis]SFB18669.1 Putative TM nitroreductase [Acetitomaculum ruminis DSM 5522]
MTLKDAILFRHSVRNYKSDKIEPEKIQKLNEKIIELNEEGNIHLQFIEDAGNTYNKLLNRAMGLGSAPSVIACAGPNDETLDQRIGYYGEKLVLYAQCLGLNTCWAGTFNKKNIGAEILSGERLVISIAIGYGKNSGKQRKSKKIEQVTDVHGDLPEWFKNGVEMALLAPTAINQQKFIIHLNEDETVEFEDKGGVLSQVDIGIVKCHFEIGADKMIK